VLSQTETRRQDRNIIFNRKPILTGEEICLYSAAQNVFMSGMRIEHEIQIWKIIGARQINRNGISTGCISMSAQ
jgi:hypothetical protein